MIRLLLVAGILFATTAFAETITISISAAAKSDLATVAAFDGLTPEQWLSIRAESIIKRRERVVREQIIESLKLRISGPLTTEQLKQAWDTGRIPTPFPTPSPYPTDTPAPTFTPTNTATPTRTETPAPTATATKTPPGQSGGGGPK